MTIEELEQMSDEEVLRAVDRSSAEVRKLCGIIHGLQIYIKHLEGLRKRDKEALRTELVEIVDKLS